MNIKSLTAVGFCKIYEDHTNILPLFKMVFLNHSECEDRSVVHNFPVGIHLGAILISMTCRSLSSTCLS